MQHLTLFILMVEKNTSPYLTLVFAGFSHSTSELWFSFMSLQRGSRIFSLSVVKDIIFYLNPQTMNLFAIWPLYIFKCMIKTPTQPRETLKSIVSLNVTL